MDVTSTSDSLKQRLLLGIPRMLEVWDDFKNFSYLDRCGVTTEDVPELIRIAKLWEDDDRLADLVDECADEQANLLPVCAWRALAELRAADATSAMLEILNAMPEDGDDWSCEDLPRVFGQFGETSIPVLIDFAKNDINSPFARAIAIDGLAKIAMSKSNPASRSARKVVIDYLTEAIQNAGEHPQPVDEDDEIWDLDFIRFNSSLLMALLDLRVAEAAPYIEKAFSENQIDVGMAGNWNDVSRELGVSSLGLPMPTRPIDSGIVFRQNVGFNIFSDRPLVDFAAHEPDFEATQEYYENALDAFSRSDEGKLVEEKFGNVGWVWNFLKLGIDYLGRTVETMSVDDAEEIVFEIVPRKVSTEAKNSESIIFELRKFWEFIDRVHDLPIARQMIELFDNDAVNRLHRELSDSRNFGMAKAMFMQGQAAGFDMTTQAGMAVFQMAYNASLLAQQTHDEISSFHDPMARIDHEHPSSPPKPKMTASEKKAFNKKRKKQLAKKLKKS